jgi:hypothetical protein
MNAKWLVVAVLVMCAAGCGYSIKASTEYDPKVDLSNYATFFMMKGNSSGDPAMDERLVSSVEDALTGKGWLKVPEGEGQAAVVINAATKTNHTYETFYNGWGGWRWRWAEPGAAPSTPGRNFVEDYKVGTVVVTIFDAKSKRAVWRGFATDALSNSPQQNAKATDEAVAKIFNHLPPDSVTATSGPDITIDRLRPDLALADTEATGSESPVGNDPPAIIFSASPAVLILIDGGHPVYRPVPGTELQRIVNTRALIVRDVTGMVYLKIRDGWMQAYSLDAGWWSVAGVPPDGAKIALQQAVASKTVDLIDGADPKNPAGRPSLANGSAPVIFISTTPAMLIVTDGPMVFAPIEGTSLEYVVNTSADVFTEPTDQELYVLASGRWFRSWTTEGPWQFVATSELPADFARIPDGSPKAGVKTAIPAHPR